MNSRRGVALERRYRRQKLRDASRWEAIISVVREDARVFFADEGDYQTPGSNLHRTRERYSA